MLSSLGNNGALVDSYRRNSAGVQRALERLSTGKRINRPSDDPAGFVAAEEIRSEIVRLQAELKSIGRRRLATRMEQSTLADIQTQLTDLRGLFVGAGDGMLTGEQRELYQQQIDAALEAIGRIEEQAGGGRALNVSATLAGLQADDAAAAAARVEAEADSVSFSRSGLAAAEKYELDVQQQMAEDSIVIHTEALSQIEDADFAEEASNLAASQVLTESALLAIGLSNDIYAEHIGALLEAVDQAVE